MTTEFPAVPHSSFSELQLLRKAATNLIPEVLKSPGTVVIENNEALGAAADHEDIERAFPSTYGRPRVTIKTGAAWQPKPLRIGVVLSGGQAPGGHNVISGIYDYVKKISPLSAVIGFLDGPHGVYTGQYSLITDEFIDSYRNSGGFDMIGSGRHKIEKPEQFASAMANCVSLDLDGLVVIGGDDSNTNAALLAEYFEKNACKTKVCGCPKTIDGDLKVDPYIPTSFGFDTACRTYSELIGNLGQDVLSAQKYYHFVRLMGRSASHIALECALQTRPNVCIICEEVQAKGSTLVQLTQQVGKNYGIVLLPEGLIEFIPEFNALISEINDVLATGVETTEAAVMEKLSPANQAVFSYLPDNIKQQLLLDRDPHGNVQVAKIETEKLLAQTVAAELARLEATGEFTGKFNPQFHSYGYEGRSGLPSKFDATYCYILGQNVASLISLGQTGLISSVTNLSGPVLEWTCGGVPITMMCNMEKRHGHMKPVIKKALVELDGEPFKCFASQREDWALFDLYRSPGPLQIAFDPHSVDLSITTTLELNRGVDVRMSPESLEAAKVLQRASWGAKFGRFIHAPVAGGAVAILSDFQRRPLTNPSLSSVKTGRRNIGVVFCGRQAPGGHDVIAGLKTHAADWAHEVMGFVGGVEGLVAGHVIHVTDDLAAAYRGQGGFDLLGRSSDRIAPESYEKITAVLKLHAIQRLVLIGGSRTANDGYQLAQYLKAQGEAIDVVVVPVDISASLKSKQVEASVGFDTATKVSGQLVGNNATDGKSAKKYYYFMRQMGQQPSHTTLEVALLTKPNYVILSEEVLARRLSLTDVVESIADVVAARAAAGKNYGTVLIPEGLISAIPEVAILVQDIDRSYSKLLTQGKALRGITAEEVKAAMTPWNKALLETLPGYLIAELLMDRSSDGLLNLSAVETERFLADLVDAELKLRKAAGTYKGAFSVVCSFLGYQARGSAPTKFDSDLAFKLGDLAANAPLEAGSAYVVSFSKLALPEEQWEPAVVDVTTLRKRDASGAGFPAPAPLKIPKSMVDLSGPAYAALAEARASWVVDDKYENPGPIQTGFQVKIQTYEFEKTEA